MMFFPGTMGRVTFFRRAEDTFFRNAKTGGGEARTFQVPVSPPVFF